MSKVTIFSEKPSQAKAYADAFQVKEKHKTYIELNPCDTFPQGATITWGVGHLVELQMPQEYKEEWAKWNLSNLPIIPENFNFKYKTKKTSSAQFNVLKELFKKCESENGILINGADVDREGSLIFALCKMHSGVKDVETKRLWINSLETDEIKKGFNNLQDNKKDLLMFEEAQTRQLADWLVGINCSQLYTLLLQQKGVNGVFSVGRVQTVLTYLIYQRDKEIQEFVSKPFYELEAEFQHENGNYKGKSKIKEDAKETVQDMIKDAGINELTSQDAVIKQADKKLKNTKSPKLHSLSTLQSTANKQWKYNPSKVLKIVQSLYEKKIVSYPRTDCNHITDAEFEYLASNVEKYQVLMNVVFDANKEPNKRYVDSKKVQEHYALVPTKNIPSEKTIASLSGEEKNIYFEVLSTTLAMFHQDYEYEETHIITNINDIEFHTKGKIEVNKGWKELFPRKEDNKKDKDPLPDVNESDEVSAIANIAERFTTAPKPYTEGQLINLMKTAGKMVDGEEDSDILKEIEGIGTEATRSGIIETVKQKEYIKVSKNIVSITGKGEILSEAVKGTLLASPSMTAKWETYLKKIGEGNGSKETFLNNIKKFLTSTIEGATKQIESMDSTIQQHNQSKGITDCPSCENGRLEDKGKFYGCTSYKDGCKVTFPKKLAGKTLSESIIKTLCTKKETNKLKGFSGKKGKFDTKLTLNEKNEIKFKFN